MSRECRGQLLSIHLRGVDEEKDLGRVPEVGIAAGAYAAVVEDGYDGEGLEVTLRAPDRREFGELTFRTSAAEHYNKDETTAATYGKEAMRELQLK